MKVKNINELKVWDYIYITSKLPNYSNYTTDYSIAKIKNIKVLKDKAIICSNIFCGVKLSIDTEWNFTREDQDVILDNNYMDKIYDGTWNKDDKTLCFYMDTLTLTYDWHETIYNKKWDEILRIYDYDGDYMDINITKKEII